MQKLTAPRDQDICRINDDNLRICSRQHAVDIPQSYSNKPNDGELEERLCVAGKKAEARYGGWRLT